MLLLASIIVWLLEYCATFSCTLTLVEASLVYILIVDLNLSDPVVMLCRSYGDRSLHKVRCAGNLQNLEG